MTAKELSQLCYLNREIDQAWQELARLQHDTGDGTKEEAALVAQTKALREKIRRRGKERDRLRAYIDGVEDAQMRMIRRPQYGGRRAEGVFSLFTGSLKVVRFVRFSHAMLMVWL